MPDLFNPAREEQNAQTFNTLAELFDRPEQRAICDRLSLLVALCEEKASLLRELEQLPEFRPDSRKHGSEAPIFAAHMQALAV